MVKRFHGTWSATALALAAQLSAVSPVHAITGGEYVSLPPEERLAYTSGLVDGHSILAGGRPELMRCIEARTYREWYEAFDAWIAAHDKRHRMNGGALFALAMNDICPE